MAVKVMLKKIRQSRGLSQNQLAQQIGTSLQNIQKIEYGKTKGIQYEMLNKLCQLLQCQPGDLLEWIPDDELDNREMNIQTRESHPQEEDTDTINNKPSLKPSKRNFLNVVPEVEVLESA
jgi:putative transcriptional regulator